MSQLSFDDSEAYERFVGKWGRAAGSIFLDWLDPPRDADWLDVGCGTGLFTELIGQKSAPASVIGVDPVCTQIDYARRKPMAGYAAFQVADGQALPFADATFDVVASALVINFIPDRRKALSEMRRVVRSGGLVGGYIWDFARELSPSGPFRLGLRDVIGDIPPLPGTEDSEPSRLGALFEGAGLGDIVTRSADVMVEFPDFDAFWTAQTPSYAPTTGIIANLTARDREHVIGAVRARLSPSANGAVRYWARANAVRARAF